MAEMDAAKFESYMWDLNSYGFTLVAVCFGNEVGLFDKIMEEDRPMTSEEIAETAGMKERYVREWLGCMVAGKIVLLEGDKYNIPKERHDTIKGVSAWGYGAVAWVRRFEQTKKCFSKDGPWGFDYDSDNDFWTFFGGFREKTGDGFIDDAVIPATKEHLPDFQDKLAKGIAVLDIGCGTGKFTRSFAKRFPNSEFTGLDSCLKPLKLAKEHQVRAELSNLSYIQGDVHKLSTELAGKYDFLMVYDCLHDLSNPKEALVQMSKILKPGGKIMIMDFIPHSKQADNAGDMMAAMFYSCSIFCCLQSSMLNTPRLGYGTCWGEEEMTKMIESVLTREKTVKLPLYHALFFCSKKDD